MSKRIRKSRKSRTRKGGAHKARRFSRRAASHHRPHLTKRPTLKREGYHIKSHARGNAKNKAVSIRNIHRSIVNLIQPNSKMSVEKVAAPRRESLHRLAKDIATVQRQEEQEAREAAKVRHEMQARHRQSMNDLNSLFGKMAM